MCLLVLLLKLFEAFIALSRVHFARHPLGFVSYLVIKILRHFVAVYVKFHNRYFSSTLQISNYFLSMLKIILGVAEDVARNLGLEFRMPSRIYSHIGVLRVP